MSNLTPLKPQTALVSAEQQQAIRTALRTSLYPGAAENSVEMVLAYCHAAGLDPMTKPVHIVPMRVKKPGSRDDYEWRDVVMPGIELYRTKAHRTGEYAGQDEAEFGPTVEQKLGAANVRFPEWCRVTVYRVVGGERVPFSAKVYWLETYATAKSGSDEPNAMWKKRPFGQLEKCAEALALRKAFPEAVGAQPTAEEMEGRIIDVEPAVPERPAMPRALPQARTEPSPAAASVTQDQAEGSWPQNDSAPAGEAGINGLTDGQHRLLTTKAKQAGLADEAALLARFPSITPANINDVLAALRDMGEGAR